MIFDTLIVSVHKKKVIEQYQEYSKTYDLLSSLLRNIYSCRHFLVQLLTISAVVNSFYIEFLNKVINITVADY